ncbi:MAG: DUF1330 domain-containing protein [Rhodobacteraceae bacterium]|nr:DUF1330 domain-containing protein [Paracoccaceae bacterium]
MPKGYWVMLVQVKDPVRYAQCAEAGLDALERTGGRVIMRGEAEVRAGNPKGRVVVVEFESIEEARERFGDETYQAAVQLYDGLADYDFLIVEGRADGPAPRLRTIAPSWGVVPPPETV